MFSRYGQLSLNFDSSIKKLGGNAQAAIKVDFSRLDDWAPPPADKDTNGWMTKLKVRSMQIRTC